MEIFEMEKEFNDLMKAGQELIKKLKKEQVTDDSKKAKRWKPKGGNVYYYINTSGDIDNFIWFGVSGSSVDNKLYKINNCFQTREEARKELHRRIAEQELLDMTDGPLNRSLNGWWYEIEYKPKEDCFICGGYSVISSSCYRFASEESCQKAIDTIGTEKLKLIFRID